MGRNKNPLDITVMFYIAAIAGGRHHLAVAQMLSAGPAAMAQAPVSLNLDAQSYQQFSGAYGTRYHRDANALHRK